jgi:hypothetical protein
MKTSDLLPLQSFVIDPLQIANCKMQIVNCRSRFFSLQFAILILLLVAGAARADEAAVAPKDDVIRLFDGKTLGDCYTWLSDTKRDDPRRVFRVTDGMLHVTGDGLGGILTNKRYENYHLVLEFKWGERTWHGRENAARDSGLLLHSNGIDGGYGGNWMPSIEANIIEGGIGDIVPVPGPDERQKPVPIAYICNVRRDGDQVIWDPKGPREEFHRGNLKRINWYGRDPAWKDVTGVRGPRDPDSPLGQWTRLDVISDGGHLEIFVNGTKVNEAFDVSPRSGRLQLQSELAEIYYRRSAKGPNRNQQSNRNP